MEPAFYRGDLLFLTNYEQHPVQAGEILVFKVKGRDIPIVHRVIKIHEKCVQLALNYCMFSACSPETTALSLIH